MNADRTRTDQHPPTQGRSRRWRAWALAAAAAAAVVAVPVLVLDGDDAGPDGPAASPSTGTSPKASPSASQSTSPGTEPSSYDLLGDDVTEGDPPALPYLARDELVRPDGTRVTLPRAYDQFTVLGERVVGAYDEQGDRSLEILDASREVERRSPLTGSFVVDLPGGLVAWATPQGELETVWADGRLSLGNQGGPVKVTAVTGSCADGSCRVYVDNVDYRPPRYVTPDGSVGEVAPGAIGVRDVHPSGLAAVMTSVSDVGSCSGVYDAEADRYLWESCEYSLFRFSPDAEYLLASAPYLDGLGLSSVTVLAVATGEPVVTFTIDGGFVAQEIWEDSTHPLVLVSGPAGWEILRLGLDGTRERAVGPVTAAQDVTLPKVLLPGNF